MADRYAAWRVLERRRTVCLMEGLCTCCAFIRRVGDPWPRPVRAVCWWTTSTGHRALLCASCLAYWQTNAADDPTLEPRSLVMLGAEHG